MIKSISSIEYIDFSQPDNRAIDEKKFILKTDWKCHVIINGIELDFVVLAGFEHDCGSIPRALWSIIGLTPSGIGEAAWLAHDVMYITKGFRDIANVKDNIIIATAPVFCRKSTDQFCRLNLVKSGVKKIRANVAYFGLKIGGWAHWGHDTVKNGWHI